jgi:hypothetical protein
MYSLSEQMLFELKGMIGAEIISCDRTRAQSDRGSKRKDKRNENGEIYSW